LAAGGGLPGAAEPGKPVPADVQALLSSDMLQKLHDAVARSVLSVFWMVLVASILCLLLCLLLPRDPVHRSGSTAE